MGGNGKKIHILHARLRLVINTIPCAAAVRAAIETCPAGSEIDLSGRNRIKVNVRDPALVWRHADRLPGCPVIAAGIQHARIISGGRGTY